MNLIAKVEFMKMSAPQEKAQCVSLFIEIKSDIQAQRNFSLMSDFVSINQETHWAFSCGVLIFMNSTSASKFKNILLNHYLNCNFKPNYFQKYLLRKKKLEAFSFTIKQIK